MLKYSIRQIAEQSAELVSRQIKLILIYSKFPKVSGKVLGLDLKLAKCGRKDKGMSLLLLPSSDQSLANCFHSFLNILSNQSLIFVISCTCAVCWWMPYSLYPLQRPGSLQISENLEDQSFWYLINLLIFLRPVQCLKSVTSSFPYFNTIFSELQNHCS